MVEDVKPHQLVKQIPGSQLIYFESPGTSFATNGWDVIDVNPTAPGVFWVYRTYIDLAGYSVDDLTMFTKGVDIQKQAITTTLIGNVAKTWDEYDILTTRRITDDEITGLHLGSGPGFALSTVDLQQVIYGEVDQLASNTQVPSTFIRINRDTFGSGVPTAMDKLHWTRVLFVPGTAAAPGPAEADNWIVFPTNLIVDAVTAKEEDLVWVERVRRSYQLQEEL